MMSLHEALDAIYMGRVSRGVSTEYLLLRQAVRKLTAEQVRELEALTRDLDMPCPICGTGMPADLVCPHCGHDEVEAHEDVKRRRLAEQQEY